SGVQAPERLNTRMPERLNVHLPLQFTRFFGREEEIARLTEMLAPLTPHASRLLTLTGPGGTGKTRLAIETARQLSEAFLGGLWFVPLADLSDPRLIPGAILDALRLPRSPQQEPLDQVVEFLYRRDVQRISSGTVGADVRCTSLLVLDNLEHLLAS